MAGSGVIDRVLADRVRFADVDGIRTCYYEEGAGAPIVLIYGGDYGFVSSLWNWSRNIGGLAEDFHVYAYDKLGQGFTDNPKRDEDYTFEALYEHLLGFLRALDIPAAHVVGHSRGGFLATWLALEHPEMVRTLVMVDSGTTAAEETGAHPFYEGLDRRTRGMASTRELLRFRVVSNSWGNEHATDDLVEQLWEIASLPKTQAAQERMRALKQSVWTPSLQARQQEVLRRIDEQGLQVPTVVAWGFDDPSAQIAVGQRLFARICRRTARASMHVFNRAGHPVYREQPDAFNRLVRAYCDH